MMDIYFVYKIGKSKEGEMLLHPLLYGYTDSKKTIKRFKKERDMSQFHIVEKDLDKKDLLLFERNNRYQRIGIRKYITYQKDEYGYNKDYVEIASTEYEEEQTYVWTDVALLEAGKYTKYPDYIFNDEVRKALHHLEYDMIREYSLTGGPDIMYPPVKVGKKTLPNIEVDMFYVFMYLFGYTMNK